MGESEVLEIVNNFKSVYRFISRGNYAQQIDKEALEEMDIEAEIYNDILTYIDKSSESILVLSSNSRESIVTGFYVYRHQNITDWLDNKIKNTGLIKLFNDDSLFLVSSIRKSTQSLQQFSEQTQSGIWGIAARSLPGDFRNIENTTRVIEEELNLYASSSFNIENFENQIPTILTQHGQLEIELEGKGKPVWFLLVSAEGIVAHLSINTGYSKKELLETFNFGSSKFRPSTNTFNLIPRIKFDYNFKVSNFNDLVEPVAQSFLVKKVRGYAGRRVLGRKPLKGPYGLLEANWAMTYVKFFIDKNFRNPTNAILNNVYLIPDADKIFSDIEQLKTLNKNILQFTDIDRNVKLGKAIELSVKAYQEAWGSYKPLSIQFFTGKEFAAPEKRDGKPVVRRGAEHYSRVRELFYNILYAYVDKALGGHISMGGKRTYNPKVDNEPRGKTVKKSDRERRLRGQTTAQEVFDYMNRVDDLEHSTIYDFFTIIKEFMIERSLALNNDNISINKILKDNELETKEFLDRQGFSVDKDLPVGGLYLVSIVGIEGTDEGIFNNIKQSFDLPYKISNYLRRNYYQYFIEIDTKNMEINVIRASLVDDATQFRINFQDWDIRIDLINLLNRLISKPKDLVVSDKGRVGLSKPANPAERSLYNLNDKNLMQQGVVDHPLTLHYEPMRFDKVTRQRSGHLFFENTEGILVIFPFDTFYHDIEGQGRRTIDICFTSVNHIYDSELYELIREGLRVQFSKWIRKNKSIISTMMSPNKEEMNKFLRDGLFKPNSSLSPYITPQVFKAIFMKAIQERLEGHKFKNAPDNRAACVYVNRYDKGFYSVGDEGWKLGTKTDSVSEAFPWNWKTFDKVSNGGGSTVSELNPKIGGFVDEIMALWKNIKSSSSVFSISRMIALNADIEEEFGYNLYGSQIEFFYGKLFTNYINNATSDNSEPGLKLMVREEIKKYLKKNPEAIQLKDIARRNMSGN